MGMFQKVPGSQVGGGGVYFQMNRAPGYTDGKYPDQWISTRYKVEVEACKAIHSRASDDLFIVECKILESDCPARPAGTKASWTVKLNQDAGPGNVKGFVAVATGSDPEEVDEAACELIVSPENPLAGTVLHLAVVPIAKRNKEVFSKHIWELAQ